MTDDAPPVPDAGQTLADQPVDPPGGHVPLLKRFQHSVTKAQAFRGPEGRLWLLGGLFALILLVLFPLRFPSFYPDAQQVAAILSLAFLLSAFGLWFGMGNRAFVVAFVLTLVLLVLSRGTRFAFQSGFDDLFLLALVVSFALFALSGFYVVLILEEMVHDAHRTLHLKEASRALAVVPMVVFLLLAVGLPISAQQGGPELPRTATAALVALGLVTCWWLWRVRSGQVWERNDRGLRELHLLGFAAVAACALADLLGSIAHSTGPVPGIIAYLLLIATWVYVSYTTLQRTHALMPGRDPRPWLAIMLSASFAILVHSRGLFQAEGHHAIEALLARRITYLVAGIWIGLAFHLLRTLTEALLEARKRAKNPKPAETGARITGGILQTEQRVEGAVQALYAGVDRVLPGKRKPPERRLRRR